MKNSSEKEENMKERKKQTINNEREKEGKQRQSLKVNLCNSNIVILDIGIGNRLIHAR